MDEVNTPGTVCNCRALLERVDGKAQVYLNGDALCHVQTLGYATGQLFLNYISNPYLNVLRQKNTDIGTNNFLYLIIEQAF
jgi:hypothetical protein